MDAVKDEHLMTLTRLINFTAIEAEREQEMKARADSYEDFIAERAHVKLLE